MKRTILILLIMISLVLNGCSGEVNTGDNETSEGISSEEMKRVDLYVTAMKAAFNEENGGNGFIAVRLDTLEGLSDKGKSEVLKRLEDLSENVYSFQEVENDETKFEKHEGGNFDGHLVRTLNGTLLSIDLEKYSKSSAVIQATSWFGNLGAVFPKYKATYEDNKWTLKLIAMAVS